LDKHNYVYKKGGQAEMKVKDKVYHFCINLDFKENKVEQTKKEYTVIGVNDSYLCINDYHFNAIKRKKAYRGDNDGLFNEVSVYQSHFSTYWDYIKADLYTSSPSEKIAYRRMKKALEKFIYEKHGRYCNAISFLDKIQLQGVTNEETN
jgi:hypothetical protein